MVRTLHFHCWSPGLTPGQGTRSGKLGGLAKKKTTKTNRSNRHITLCKFKVYPVLRVKVAHSCLTLDDPVDCSPPSSSVHGTLQARILE